MSMADYAEAEVAKYLFTTEAMGTRPTAWYIALHTGDPSDTGSNNEVFAGWYARQAATFTRTNGTLVNAGAVTFAAVTGAGLTITHVTIRDASSGGNVLAVLSLPSVTYAIGDIANIAAGALSFNID